VNNLPKAVTQQCSAGTNAILICIGRIGLSSCLHALLFVKTLCRLAYINHTLDPARMPSLETTAVDIGPHTNVSGYSPAFYSSVFPLRGGGL